MTRHSNEQIERVAVAIEDIDDGDDCITITAIVALDAAIPPDCQVMPKTLDPAAQERGAREIYDIFRPTVAKTFESLNKSDLAGLLGVTQAIYGEIYAADAPQPLRSEGCGQGGTGMSLHREAQIERVAKAIRVASELAEGLNPGKDCFMFIAADALDAAIPEGWRLVPIEPTSPMIEEAEDALDQGGPAFEGSTSYSAVADAIRAAIAAAPEPGTETPKDERMMRGIST